MDYYANVPLKYHKFLKFFGLPVSILSILGDIAGSVNLQNGSYYPYTYPSQEIKNLLSFNIMFDVACIVIVAVILYGFYTVRPCGYVGIQTYIILRCAWSLLLIFLYLDLMPNQVSSALGSFIGSSIVAVFQFIYYKKRRFMFYDEEPPAKWAISKAPSDQLTAPSDMVISAPDAVRFCRKCGAMLLADSQFCAKCGTAVIEVE